MGYLCVKHCARYYEEKKKKINLTQTLLSKQNSVEVYGENLASYRFVVAF